MLFHQTPKYMTKKHVGIFVVEFNLEETRKLLREIETMNSRDIGEIMYQLYRGLQQQVAMHDGDLRHFGG